MNNGGKAEKENTPNEANLQEEEVRRGWVRWRVRHGTAFSEVRAAGPVGRGSRGARLRRSRGVAVEGLGIALAPRRSPKLWPPDGGSWESVFLWVHARLRA